MKGFSRITHSAHAVVFTLMVLLVLISHNLNAEVYRWVDANGKTHYSDKKTAKNADDITAEVRKQNIDTSSEEQRKLKKIFRPENEADRAYHRQQQLREQPDTEMVQHCKEQRNYLHHIKGRVQFIDEQGQIIKVTEKERQAEVLRVEDYIASRC